MEAERGIGEERVSVRHNAAQNQHECRAEGRKRAGREGALGVWHVAREPFVEELLWIIHQVLERVFVFVVFLVCFVTEFSRVADGPAPHIGAWD